MSMAGCGGTWKIQKYDDLEIAAGFAMVLLVIFHELCVMMIL